jgi:hypothetical protein
MFLVSLLPKNHEEEFISHSSHFGGKVYLQTGFEKEGIGSSYVPIKVQINKFSFLHPYDHLRKENTD